MFYLSMCKKTTKSNQIILKNKKNMSKNVETQTAVLEAPTKKMVSGAEAICMCLLEEGVDLVFGYPGGAIDRKSTRLNSSHLARSRMPSSA